MQSVLEDVKTAPIPEAEKALLAFVDTLNHHPETLGPAHIATLKAVGWTDEAIYDAVSVCALFNFYNRWIDGTGVRGLPTEAYRRMGERLAQAGYAAPDPKPSGPSGK